MSFGANHAAIGNGKFSCENCIPFRREIGSPEEQSSTFLCDGHAFGFSKVVGHLVDPTDLENCQTKLSLVLHLRHNNIVRILDVILFRNSYLAIRPFYECGSVKSKLLSHYTFGFSEAITLFILRQIISALEYLHSKFYVHRGIRCGNIFLTAHGQLAVLSGFDNAATLIDDGRVKKALYDFSGQYKNCLNWLAPEVIQQDQDGYSINSDVYMLGATIVEMCNGLEPYYKFQPYQIMLAKYRDCKPMLIDKNTATLISEVSYPLEQSDGIPRELTCKDYSRELHKLTASCMRYRPEERPLIVELKDKFGKSFDHHKNLKDSDARRLFEPISIPQFTDYKIDSLFANEASDNEDIVWDF